MPSRTLRAPALREDRLLARLREPGRGPCVCALARRPDPHRAGVPSRSLRRSVGAERPYPWGAAAPADRHGNFNLRCWSPTPVGSSPEGASAWGVHELVGNGWEWTDTPFAGFPGFEAWIPGYTGYSADFFDGKHFVLKGASRASAT